MYKKAKAILATAVVWNLEPWPWPSPASKRERGGEGRKKTRERNSVYPRKPKALKLSDQNYDFDGIHAIVLVSVSVQ